MFVPGLLLTALSALPIAIVSAVSVPTFENVNPQIPLVPPSPPQNDNTNADAITDANAKRVRPLVLWHGLGDSHSSTGMLEFAELIKAEHPGIFVHSVYIEEDLDKDQRAGFFGNVNDQVEIVAAQLSSIDELKDGFDAIGFSQGGQFLRAYLERYNDPPMHNLITFGSQHMGIADLPMCRPGDIWCQLARRAAKAGVYSEWAQKNLVQAQYFRDPDQLPAYFLSNTFLTSINNEVAESINTTYRDNFLSLNTLVLVLFTEDRTVVPKESAWFGSFATEKKDVDGSFVDEEEEVDAVGTAHKEIIPMRLQPVYLHDTFGLKTLDERGGVKLVACEAEHMRLSEECWKPLVKKYTGGKL